MTGIQRLADTDVGVRSFEYDESAVLAADFGPTIDASVDVVGETVIVVADGEQYDLAVGERAEARIHNGVLTIEISDDSPSKESAVTRKSGNESDDRAETEESGENEDSA